MRCSEGVIFCGLWWWKERKYVVRKYICGFMWAQSCKIYAQLYLAVWRQMKALVETKPFATLSLGELCVKWHRLARSRASPSSIYPLLRRWPSGCPQPKLEIIPFFFLLAQTGGLQGVYDTAIQLDSMQICFRLELQMWAPSMINRRLFRSNSASSSTFLPSKTSPVAIRASVSSSQFWRSFQSSKVQEPCETAAAVPEFLEAPMVPFT